MFFGSSNTCVFPSKITKNNNNIEVSSKRFSTTPSIYYSFRNKQRINMNKERQKRWQDHIEIFKFEMSSALLSKNMTRIHNVQPLATGLPADTSSNTSENMKQL